MTKRILLFLALNVKFGALAAVTYSWSSSLANFSVSSCPGESVGIAGAATSFLSGSNFRQTTCRNALLMEDGWKATLKYTVTVAKDMSQFDIYIVPIQETYQVGGYSYPISYLQPSPANLEAICKGRKGLFSTSGGTKWLSVTCRKSVFLTNQYTYSFEDSYGFSWSFSATQSEAGLYFMVTTAGGSNQQIAYAVDTKVEWADGPSASAPENDNFSKASAISGRSGLVTGSNVGATSQSGEPLLSSYSTAKTTVWWKWTAPASGDVQIDTIGSSFDTQMGIYTGSSLSALRLVAKDDDSGGSSYASKTTFACDAGTTYYICVGGYQGKTGTVKLNWNLTPLSPPSSPTGVTATENSSTQVKVSWTAAARAENYLIIRWDGTDEGLEDAPVFETTSTSYVDKTAVPGVRYYYIVMAENRAGLSPEDDYGYAEGMRLVSVAFSPATRSVPGAGGSFSVSVTANTDWRASTTDGWITLSGDASGTGNGTISYFVQSNPMAAERQGTIALVAGAGTEDEKTVAFSVLQNRAPVNVTFDSAGGSTVDGSRMLEVGSAYGTLPTSSRLGHTLVGWYDGETQVTATSIVPPRNVTLLAKWRPNTSTVSFHSEHLGIGAGAMESQTFDYGTSVALAGCGFTRVGYAFVGWATESGGPVRYRDGQDILNLSEEDGAKLDFYAVWEEGKPAGSVKVTAVAAAPRWPWNGKVDVDYALVCEPATGWATVELTARDNDRRRDLQPKTLEGDGASGAVRSGTHRLTWDVAADYPGFDTTSLDIGVKASGETIPVVEGVTASQDQSEGVELAWRESKDAAAYEIWRGMSDAPQDAELLGTVLGGRFRDLAVDDGEVYYYWIRSLGSSSVSEWGDSIRCCSSISIVFNGNGGSPSVVSRRYVPGTPFGEFVSASREGYVLVGWSVDEAGYVRVDEASCVPADCSCLYAQWKPVAYQVSFVGNGGEGNMPPLDLQYDEARTLPDNAFTREGMAFVGWALTANGEVKYAEGATACNLATEEGAVVALYARWVPTEPKNVVASNGTSEEGVDITWDPSCAADAYVIYRSLNGNYGSRVKVGETQDCHYTDTTLKMSETATYWIVASVGEGTKLYSEPSSGVVGKKKAVVNSFNISKCFGRTDNTMYNWDEVILSPTIKYKDGSTAIVKATWSYDSRYASITWTEAASWHPEGYRYLALGSSTWTSSDASRGYISATVTGTSIVNGVSYSSTVYLRINYNGGDPW